MSRESESGQAFTREVVVVWSARQSPPCPISLPYFDTEPSIWTLDSVEEDEIRSRQEIDRDQAVLFSIIYSAPIGRS